MIASTPVGRSDDDPAVPRQNTMTDLDDAAAIEQSDIARSLRGAALGGAQVRAVAELVKEQALRPLAGMRPRSVVFITNGGRAPRAVALLTAALNAGAGLPIVSASAAPPWAGPLDVLVVAGDDSGDPVLAEAVRQGLRRGAEVVVAMPDEGPVRVAAAGRGLKLPPRMRVPSHNTLLGHLAAGMAVMRAVDPVRAGTLIPDLDSLADSLDTEAARDTPAQELFGNPAKSLASRMHQRAVIFAGSDIATSALAVHGADMMLAVTGSPAGAASLDGALAAAAAQRSAAPAVDPLFYDEEFDGPMPGIQLRTFVLSAEPDQALVRRRMAALADADLVSADDAGPPVDTLSQLAVLALRLELAVVYLRILGGTG